MWIDCWETLVNLERVDYISFDFEDEEIPTAYVYFAGREEPLLFHAEDMAELQNYFSVHTIGREMNEQ
jgi:hypothetical protein